MNTKKLISIMALVSVLATGCLKKSGVDEIKEERKAVKVQSVKESRVIKQELEFPGLVSANEEAKLYAKSAGTVRTLNLEPGKTVRLGDLLVKVDDVEKGGSQSDFNNNQIQQARVGASQAETSWRMAKANYESLLMSTGKDLNSVDIAKNQAVAGKDNLTSLTNETIKSAELAYESAKLATQQAKVNFDSRRKLTSQGASDADTNASIASDNVYNSCSNIINGLNKIFGFDDNISVDISYKSSLGVMNSTALTNAKSSYLIASNLAKSYSSQVFATLKDRVDYIIKLADATKQLADGSKDVLDNTITSSSLPASSVTGVSLQSLNAQVFGYQSQLSGNLSQINGAKSSLENINITNDATLEVLAKAYELAQKQEASALQNLTNIKSGNKSQLDNAGFGVMSAENSYDSLRIKLNNQLTVAKSQSDMAELAYHNAILALQTLVDSHMTISPISGTVTKRLINLGDTVSPGQPLGTVSKTESQKIIFFVDESNMKAIQPGMEVEIKNSDDKKIKGKISSVTPQADVVTKRFQAEVVPEKTAEQFTLGTVVTVSIKLGKKTENKNSIALPMSAVEVGQNLNAIFVAEDGRVKKLPVNILRVEGEYVEIEIKASSTPDTQIIVDGNKFLNEGDLLQISN